MSRRSVRCAVFRGDAILMVQNHVDDKTWWTLPGGGVERDESDKQAALRELHEETQLAATEAVWICDLPEPCFLIEIDDSAAPRLDMDPTLSDASEIVAVEWRSLDAVATDRQVAQILAALGR